MSPNREDFGLTVMQAEIVGVLSSRPNAISVYELARMFRDFYTTEEFLLELKDLAQSGIVTIRGDKVFYLDPETTARERKRQEEEDRKMERFRQWRDSL